MGRASRHQSYSCRAFNPSKADQFLVKAADSEYAAG